MIGLSIPHPRTTIHLYRHLLREASYLPPVARPFIFDQIKDKFRRHRRASNPKPHIRRGHHDLRYLRAANAGDLPRMRRVLLMVFGRIGGYRRDLIRKLVTPQPPANTEDLVKVMEGLKVAKEPDPEQSQLKSDWLSKWDTERVHAVAKSQVQQGLVTAPRKLADKLLNPGRHIPTENSWGRPLPKKLARTKLRKAWKTMVHKVLPPVSRDQWELLRDLAEGNKRGKEWEIPARRTVAACNGLEELRRPGDGEWNWESYATKSVVEVDKDKSRANRLLGGAVDDTSPAPPPPLHTHRYTARAWKRLYSDVWSMTPMMEKKAQGNGWDITWGESRFTPPQASSGHEEFFEGYAGDGNNAAPTR